MDHRMTNLDRALMVAEKAHSGQSYGIYPYMYHIKNVVNLATVNGFSEEIVVACALHDSIEDSDLTYNNIKSEFGEEVADIVYCVTDELGRSRKERKEKTYPKIKSNWKATIVKILDRYENVSYSKMTMGRMFSVYKDEHDDFCQNLISPDHPKEEMDKAWSLLNSLFE